MKEPQLPLNHSNHSSKNPPRTPRFITLGAGSRGTAYAQAVTTATNGRIHAVAEPHAFRRREFGRRFIWGSNGAPRQGQEFGDWREWVEFEAARRKRHHRDTDTDTPNEDKDSIDGVFICTLDHTHIDILHAIAANFKDLHILCEKPLALSLVDCLSVYRSLSTSTTSSTPSTQQKQHAIFSIGHVLRYSPHNNILRSLLLHDRAIGDIVSLEHTEPVGWWHFSHSYVRGNWRRETPAGDGSLLTKSCHDVDFVLWLLCSAVPGHRDTGAGADAADVHHPRTITSSGTLTQFTRANKPPLAAAAHATNCLSCPSEPECIYSAVRIYRDAHLAHGHREWPVDVVVPDIEDEYRERGIEGAEGRLLERLGEDYGVVAKTIKNNTDIDIEIDNEDEDEDDKKRDESIASRPWYGRCVYEADNSVCDDQIVTITWDAQTLPPSTSTSTRHSSEEKQKENRRLRPKTAVLHMIAPTEKQCERRGRVYGTTGEISYDSRTIQIYDFASAETRTVDVPKQPAQEKESHGGGDYGLARGFVGAVDAVVNRGWEVQDAQVGFLGCTLEEVVRSHAVVFAAEEARREEKVVKWRDWWAEKLAAVGLVP